MKQHHALIWIVLLGMAALAFIGDWGLRAEKARRVIARETGKDDLECLWRVDGRDDVKETPSWWKIVRGARPRFIRVDWPAFQSDPRAAVEFAQAIRLFGSLEKFVADTRSPEVMTLLREFGHQPSLLYMNIFNASVTEEFSQILGNFPHLRGLSVVPGLFTGEGFAHMPDLEDADFRYGAITAQGLRDIVAASPKLTGIALSDQSSPAPELAAAIKELRASHPGLDISWNPPEE